MTDKTAGLLQERDAMQAILKEVSEDRGNLYRELQRVRKALTRALNLADHHARLLEEYGIDPDSGYPKEEIEE
jgi:hypothetical protein